MEIQWWGLATLILFYLVIFLVGVIASRRLRSGKEVNASEDAMLAGRNLGLWVGIFSMTATWVDGGSINGSAEVVFEKGLIWCQGPVCNALSLVIGGFLYATKMRDKGYVTVLDPFQQNYGKWITALFYFPNIVGAILYYGAVFAALGDTMAEVINLDVRISIIASGVVSVLYTLAGGMYSVTYTDVVEIFLILLGLWLCIPFCLQNNNVGPIAESYTDFWGTVKPVEVGQWIDTMLLLTMSGVTFQEYYQRVLSSETAAVARRISYGAAFGYILVTIPPVLVGIISRNVDWSNTNYGHRPNGTQEMSMILPITLFSLTPRVIAYLGLGSVAAATMSSTDAGILAAGTQITRIWYRNLLRPQASEREMLWVLRIAMLVFGAVSTCFALTIKTVYKILYLSGDLVYIIMVPNLTCLLYLDSHCNAWGAGTAFFICLLLRLLCGEPAINLPAVIKLPFYDEDSQTQTLPYKTLIMLIGVVLILVVSKAAVLVRRQKELKVTLIAKKSASD